jgi:ferritin-like metal-binding protein YciE
LDKQTTKINKNIMQMLQPLQKHIKSADKQSQLIKQIQSQLKELQKQVSQIQRAVSIGKKNKKKI